MFFPHKVPISKKHLFSKLRIPPHCLVLLQFSFLPSFATHSHKSTQTDNSHRLVHDVRLTEKFFTLSRSLAHTPHHISPRRFSPLSFSHTTCVCVSVCSRSRAKKNTHFSAVAVPRRSRKIFSHFRWKKSSSKEVFAENLHFFTLARDLAARPTETATRISSLKERP